MVKFGEWVGTGVSDGGYLLSPHPNHCSLLSLLYVMQFRSGFISGERDV